MEQGDIKKVVARLRLNSREKLCRIKNGYKINNDIKGNIIQKRVAIPDFYKTGFPFMVAYLIETNAKPVNAINDIHTNNCYRIYDEDMYFIEAIFHDAQDVENYDEIIKSSCKKFSKHYIVEDLKREEFIPLD